MTIWLYVFSQSLFVFNRIAGHPLAQNEKCLHMFIQEPVIDKNYVPGKIRNTWAPPVTHPVHDRNVGTAVFWN